MKRGGKRAKKTEEKQKEIGENKGRKRERNKNKKTQKKRKNRRDKNQRRKQKRTKKIENKRGTKKKGKRGIPCPCTEKKKPQQQPPFFLPTVACFPCHHYQHRREATARSTSSPSLFSSSPSVTLHYFASEQWRVNYNLFSTIHLQNSKESLYCLLGRTSSVPDQNGGVRFSPVP